MRSIVVVFAILAAGTATASAGKRSIAVLGIEVVGSSDPKTAQFAIDATVLLRTRVMAGTGPYTIAPGAAKDLVDEKRAAHCEAEAVGCMVAIGQGLGADLLVYGKVERRNAGYQLALKVLDVRKKAHANMVVQLVVFADATPRSRAVKELYAKLLGM